MSAGCISLGKAGLGSAGEVDSADRETPTVEIHPR
jgi:hypothetical protein